MRTALFTPHYSLGWYACVEIEGRTFYVKPDLIPNQRQAEKDLAFWKRRFIGKPWKVFLEEKRLDDEVKR